MIPFHTKNRIEIKDENDFNDVAQEILTEFLETFTKEDGLIRDVEEGDGADEGITFMYTSKGDRLATEMIRRLYKVGSAHFPDSLYIDVSSYMYQEI